MSKIEWTHRPGTKSEVLNPTTGCDKVSAGCRSCYAEVMHKRLTGMGQKKYQEPFLGHVKYWPEELAKPFKWKKRRTVFLNSMSDIFHKDVTVQQIAEIYAMMALTDQHTYIVLTKRAERAKEVLSSDEFFVEFHCACNRIHDLHIGRLEQEMYQFIECKEFLPLKNVWQGVSVENNEQAEIRIPDLYKTPAHVHVLSCEPLLGPIDEKWFNRRLLEMVGVKKLWVIAGGESGHKARPSHPDWFRSLRDQCESADIPFFFKQHGTWMPSEENITSLKQIDDLPLRPKEARGVELINKDGVHNRRLLIDGVTEPLVRMFKMGKKHSGNLLDGVQHLNFPK
jgi:protein gp37